VKALLVAAIVLVALTGCSLGGPSPVPTGSGAAIDHTEQSTIDGEWVVTRTVSSSDEVNNPARAVGTVSTRMVKFSDVLCSSGPCTGGVLSGPTQAVRASTTFSSSGDTIRYVFEGFVNCLRQDSSAVLVPNGYAYTETVQLKVIATDSVDQSKATTLEGTMTYTDRVTNDALKAGCSREPVSTTTAYTLSAVRGAVEQPVATPAP
jgi:predicted small lipoprotein YifL